MCGIVLSCIVCPPRGKNAAQTDIGAALLQNYLTNSKRQKGSLIIKNISKTTISAAIVSAILCGMTSSAYAAPSVEKDVIYAHTPDGTVIEIEGKPFEEEEGAVLLCADPAERDVIYAHSEDGTVIEIVGEPFEDKDGGIVVYSSSKPELNMSNFYNLSAANYDADLVEVSPQMWLYTNKYFLCSSSGEIHVRYRVKKKSGIDDVKMRIGIFDLTKNTSYTKFVTEEIKSRVNYTIGDMYFSGLNPDNYYAVGFEACLSPIGEVTLLTGDAEIGQSAIS